MIQWMSAIWFLVPLPFLNLAWPSRSSRFTYCWSLAWRTLSITLLAWNECNCVVVWTFFGIVMKTHLFQSCGHCWVFQICWCIECSTLPASSLRIWNISAGIPSPNSSRKNEEAESKQKQCPAVDVTGDGSKVWCCKEQYCIGTWNVRSMDQGKLDVVSQKMARVNINILGISELKRTGMG